MYIDTLHVRRLKLLRDFRLDFTNPDGSPRMWTVIIGRNGTGKSSILQAIAMSAAGSRLVGELAGDFVGHLVDRRANEALGIDATFQFADGARRAALHPMLGRDLKPKERLRSTSALGVGQKTIDGQSHYLGVDGKPIVMKGARAFGPLDDARSADRMRWFVAGYGVGRFLPNPQTAQTLVRPALERLRPLFSNQVALTSLRFIDLLPKDKARSFTKALRDTLLHVQGTRARRKSSPNEGLVPDLVGIELKGAGGVTSSNMLIDKDRIELRIGRGKQKLPAVALSHGYQSTLAWIADLIGHVMWEADAPVDAAEIEGLVLIDEVDLYLHPAWQVGLISALRKTFPKVQFVATTHSPVVLSALAPEEIVVVDQNPETGDVEQFVHDGETGELRPRSQVETPALVPDPRSMSGSDVYRTWFGLDRLTLNPLGEDLQEYLVHATNPHRSDAEQRTMLELQHRLEAAGLAPRPAVARRRR